MKRLYAMKIKSPPFYLPFFILFTLSNLSPIIQADLSSDKQALLHFQASISHSRRLNWNSSTPICSSWIGIACDSNRVVSVRLPGIGLAGEIPVNTLSKLDSLRVLSLRSNFLTGTIPSNLNSLQFLYLQNNNFSGELPSSLSPKLVVFDASSNSLSLGFPVIPNLTRLKKLSLQNNRFSGEIPTLDLPKLKLLNLSFNDLNGSIPNSLQNFPASSFIGNSLCGKPLKPCQSQTRKKLGPDTIIAVSIGSVAALFLVALITFICCMKRRQNIPEKAKGSARTGEKAVDFGSGVHGAEKNRLFFFPGCSYSFDLDDLLRASAEILGKGNQGTTYKAVLDEGATTVVVKRLREVTVGKREFEQSMEAVASEGQNRNVVPLRAYYYSKDEKLLVYDYMAGGSLFMRLHGFRGAERAPLDWETRVTISLATAKGLAHIHSSDGRRSVHGNIKTSNILLSASGDALVSDLGLSSVIAGPRAPGYRAPETLSASWRPTQQSDVYAFGVVLLEILTGKPALRCGGRDDVIDLPRWVRSVVREEWTAEVFDVEILCGGHAEEEMLQMLHVALACVAKVPESRPVMEDVVKMIEQLGESKSADTRPSSGSDHSIGIQTP